MKACDYCKKELIGQEAGEKRTTYELSITKWKRESNGDGEGRTMLSLEDLHKECAEKIIKLIKNSYVGKQEQ